jgi:hypothetical protein
MCGAKNQLLACNSGYVCFPCLGEAFAAIASSYDKSRGPESVKQIPPTAVTRCFVCGQPAPAGKLIAWAHPFCFCGDCLKKAFEIAADDGDEPLAVVEF